MELLLLLPLLAGVALFELFAPDQSASSDKPDDPAPVEPDDQVVQGTGNAETLSGDGGDDFVLGEANADKINGNFGDDVLLGEAGADSLSGGQGYDTIMGGVGNDTIGGGRGFDLLIGGSGDDSILGGSGADSIAGSSGADTLDGGDDDDLISGIDVRGSLTPLQVNLIDSANGATARAAAFNSYMQTTYGSEATPALLNRVTDGLSSADSTNTDDDSLLGGAGNDTLIGDLSDTLTGGAGNDSLEVVSGGAGEAVIVNDFNAAQDTLRVTVPTGTNPAISYVNGATPADGVSVVIAGDVVAVLKGLVAADIPAGRITVNVAVS